jgi:FkbH-like protein
MSASARPPIPGITKLEENGTMNGRPDPVSAALEAGSPAELALALGRRHPALTMPDVARLTRKLKSFEAPRQPVRTAVLRTFTTELLRPYWEFEFLYNGLALELYEAPYGSILPEAEAGSALRAHRPEVTFLLLQWDDLDPRLSQPIPSLSAEDRRATGAAALEHLKFVLGTLRAAVEGLIVLTLLPRRSGPALGQFDAMAAESESLFFVDLKARLAAHLREALPSVSFCDLDETAAALGRSGLFDDRLWLTSRFPFTTAGAQAVVRRLIAYPVLLKRPKAKCIALDADNTLWGGIVGEDGPRGIALGHDYPGSAFVAFQRRLLDFQQRGFVLALCSKNNPGDVMEVLKDHPHQILRPAHFAAMSINWKPKADNLRQLAKELNLGLDAFLFIDDSPHECLAVQQQLPMVTVIRTPEKPEHLPFCLDDQPRLEVLSLTDEDRRRGEMYAQERMRRELTAEVGNLNDYLVSLQMEMTVGLDDPDHVPRVAQLTQKTNQFNVTTRRYTEAEIHRFVADPDWLVAHFSLVDRFGDAGIVGVALVRGVTSGSAEFDTFLMSCRVIGRKAEAAFLAEVLRSLKEQGVSRVRGAYVPTEKNALVAEFWAQHGFTADGPGTYSLDLADDLPAPLRELPIRILSLSRGIR